MGHDAERHNPMDGRSSSDPASRAGSEESVRQEPLIRELTGDLPCVRCGYNLRGLSVRTVCPECGASVRATILAVVDPHAGELQPLSMPRLTAVGLLLWAGAAVAVALLTWGMRVSDVVELSGWGVVAHGWAPVVGAALIALSGLGAVALIRPHGQIPGTKIRSACLGVVAYVPLGLLYWRLHGVYDPIRARPYFQLDEADPNRVVLRLLTGAASILIILSLRPNARLLVARSMLLRQGRVDRQALIAMVAALLVAAAGDMLHLTASARGGGGGAIGDLARMGGTFLIAVGSMLLTLGLAGVLVDCVRLVPVILEPAPSLAQVLGRDPRDDRPTSMVGTAQQGVRDDQH